VNDTHRLAARFRERLLARREALLGSFVKTPAPQPVEILGAVGFDFVVIDAEHAPMDRQALEMTLLAARAAGIAALVRVPDAQPSSLAAALDAGAAGVIVPHVENAAIALSVVNACRFSGQRGFSNSPRAGGYGARGLWQHADASDAEVVVVGMVEDPAAVEAIEEILAVEGLDAIFIGRADLTVAYRDREPGSPRVVDATLRVLAAAAGCDMPVVLLASGAEEAQGLRAQGASAFIFSSDQGFLRQAALSALASARQCLFTS